MDGMDEGMFSLIMLKSSCYQGIFDLIINGYVDC